MTLQTQQINRVNEALSVAVAPNIFDVFFDTDLIGTLCLANLLSSGLWAFSQRILDQPDATPPESASQIPPSIRLIQKHLNKSFTHLHPVEVAAIYGFVDLHSERARLDGHFFDDAVRGLEASFVEYQKKGGALEIAGNQAISWIQEGKFPSYAYTNFDLIKAHRKLTGRSTKSPNGLTSCLDEVALFIALAIAIPKAGDVRAIMVMSSVSHYGAFGYSEDGRRWWFNGKNQLYSKNDWDRLVAEQYADNHQACFDQIFSNFSQMTTVSGVFDFASGESSIPEEYLDEYLQEMEVFFGISLRQVSDGLSKKCEATPEAPHANFFRELLGVSSRDALFERLENRTDVWVKKAFYAYRSLSVDDYTPYLLNARRGPLALSAAQSAECIEEVIKIVRSIPGAVSIFNDRERIAMPDETLRLQTGTDRDKSLLLHVLLEHYAHINALQAKVESIYTNDYSLVKVGDDWLDINSFNLWVGALPTSVKYHLCE